MVIFFFSSKKKLLRCVLWLKRTSSADEPAGLSVSSMYRGQIAPIRWNNSSVRIVMFHHEHEPLMLSLVQSFSCISMWCFGELSHSAYEKDHFNIYFLGSRMKWWVVHFTASSRRVKSLSFHKDTWMVWKRSHFFNRNSKTPSVGQWKKDGKYITSWAFPREFRKKKTKFSEKAIIWHFECECAHFVCNLIVARTH